MLSPRVLFLIFCGSLIVLISFGIRSSFGLMMGPISEGLGWTVGVFSISIAIQNLVWGLTQPIAGALADRFGSAKVISFCAFLYIVGLVIMAHTVTPTMMHLSQGVLIGMALSGTAFGVVLSAIARLVPEEQRSLALGIGTASGSLGQFLVVPVGQELLSAYGWELTLILFTVLAALMIPASLATRGAAVVSGPPQRASEALSEAARHKSYWYLTLGFFVCGFHVAFIAAHLPFYLTENGLPAYTGAWAIALIGAFNIVGSLTAGWLGGHHSKKYLLSFIYLARGFVIAAFVMIPLSQTTVFVFAALMGLLWLSTVPLTSGLVGQMFGTRHMGMLFGIVFLSHQIGSFLGVGLGGLLFDRTGSYDLIWWIGVALGVASAIVHWPIDERPVVRLAVPAAPLAVDVPSGLDD